MLDLAHHVAVHSVHLRNVHLAGGEGVGDLLVVELATHIGDGDVVSGTAVVGVADLRHVQGHLYLGLHRDMLLGTVVGHIVVPCGQLDVPRIEGYVVVIAAQLEAVEPFAQSDGRLGLEVGAGVPSVEVVSGDVELRDVLVIGDPEVHRLTLTDQQGHVGVDVGMVRTGRLDVEVHVLSDPLGDYGYLHVAGDEELDLVVLQRGLLVGDEGIGAAGRVDIGGLGGVDGEVSGEHEGQSDDGPVFQSVRGDGDGVIGAVLDQGIVDVHGLTVLVDDGDITVGPVRHDELDARRGLLHRRDVCHGVSIDRVARLDGHSVGDEEHDRLVVVDDVLNAVVVASGYGVSHGIGLLHDVLHIVEEHPIDSLGTRDGDGVVVYDPQRVGLGYPLVGHGYVAGDGFGNAGPIAFRELVILPHGLLIHTD